MKTNNAEENDKIMKFCVQNEWRIVHNYIAPSSDHSLLTTICLPFKVIIQKYELVF